MACNTEANSSLWPDMELLQYFMPVLIICNFEDQNWRRFGVHNICFGAQEHFVTGFELVRDFMAVLVSCKVDDDTIQNEGAVVSTKFSPLDVYGKFFWSSRSSNSAANSTIWSVIELVRDLMPVLVNCKFEEDLIKIKALSYPQQFPHYKSMGDFGCSGNQSFDPICPKTLCSLSPTPLMIHVKFDGRRTIAIV